MNATYIFDKCLTVIVWFGTQISNKFTVPYKKLLEWFPILETNKALKYGIIPILLVLFAGFRSLLKHIVNFFAESISDLLGNVTQVDISSKTVVFVIMAIIITTKLISQLLKRKDKNED